MLAGPQLTLDFAGMTAVIAQKQGSFLEIDGMIMRGFASRHILNRDVPLNYIIPNFGAWPSIVAEPGAQVLGIPSDPHRDPVCLTSRCIRRICGALVHQQMS